MIRYFCDICGKEYHNYGGLENTLIFQHGDVTIRLTGTLPNPGLVCQSCLLSIVAQQQYISISGGKPLRELLAAYAHNAWAEWMQYLFSKSAPIQNGCAVIPTPLVELWSYQMNIPYSFLPDSEQQTYLAQADQIVEIFGV